MHILLGALAIIIPINIYLCFLPEPATNLSPDPPIEMWTNLLYTFRLFMFVTLIVVGTASNMQVMRAYKVNYAYIFEIRPKVNESYSSVYIAGFVMALIFSVCLFL